MIVLVDFASIGKHVGSESVRAFIDQHEPLVCLTGHIHEGRGVDTIAGCPVINPGRLSEGGYARVVIGDDPDGPVVEACEVCSI